MANLASGRRSRWVLAAALLLALLGAGLTPGGVAAAACNVTVLANSGAGSLREKVADVTCDPINITISGTITLDNVGAGSTADTALVIGRSVTIANTSGGAVTLAGGAGNRRVLEIAAGATVGIAGGASGLAVSGGDPINNHGGGIYNFGALTLTKVTVRNNTIGGGAGFGGGIYNDLGLLTLIDSAVTDNTVPTIPLNFGTGGGIGNTNGTVSLTNSTVSGNDASYGGGIFNSSQTPFGGAPIAATVTMTGGSLGGNTAIVVGGGVYNAGARATATLTGVTVAGNTFTGAGLRWGAGLYNDRGALNVLGGSVVKGNSGAVAGGGIFNLAGTLTVTDSIIGGALPADANTATNDGGGIYQLAAIGQTASATLTRSAVRGNTSSTGGGIANASYGTGTLTLVDTAVDGNFANGGEGGGISNSTGNVGTATLNMTRGSISSNRTNATIVGAICRKGGALVNRGGGGGTPSATLRGVTVAGNVGTGGIAFGGVINCDGTMLIEDSTISGNTSTTVPGIANFATATGLTAALTVRRSTVSGNVGSVGGVGGIDSTADTGGTVMLDLTDSTISGNTGARGEGGVRNYAFGENSSAIATLTNTTIAGNTAKGFDRPAGGFGNHTAYDGSAATATLTNVTIVGNIGVNGGPGGIGSQALGFTTLTTLRNSVLAGNVGGNVGNFFLTSGGRNVSDDASGGLLTGPGDLNNVPAGLDPAGLQANGGPTRTIALLPGSPAIDRVPSGGANCPAADQRGTARPQGAACDSGAYEATRVATALAVAPASGVYGGTVNLTATLTAPGGPQAGRTVAFTLNGGPVGSAVTNASGVATLPSANLGGIPAGSYPSGVGASFAGVAPYLASAGNAALTVSKATTATAAQDVTVSYGDANATLTAVVSNTGPGSAAPVNEGTVTFVVTQGATTVCTVTSGTVANGTASAVCPLGALNAGSYTIQASYSGSANFLPSSDATPGRLTVARRIIVVKPQDRTVGFQQPNPPTDPHVDAACAAPNWCLQLAAGSSFAPGEGFANLNLTNLRFVYSRNYPFSNASETVGQRYAISAYGVFGTNYGIRYQAGTLTVVP